MKNKKLLYSISVVFKRFTNKKRSIHSTTCFMVQPTIMNICPMSDWMKISG